MAEDRKLEPLDSKRSKTPFAYEGNVLGSLREDQVPRFFGALTDGEDLPAKTVNLDDLTAMQNRVDTGKVKAIAANGASGKLPVVIQHDGKKYIADGHHRLAAAWLNGEDSAKVRFKNLEPEVNTMKTEVIKTDDDQHMVYGWASVISENGQPVVDTQGDVIGADDLVKATTDFMKDVRHAAEMHARNADKSFTPDLAIGQVVHSFPMTAELAKSLGIDTGREGWIVGVHVADDGVWKKVKSGELKAFSIGGSGKREEIE